MLRPDFDSDFDFDFEKAKTRFPRNATGSVLLGKRIELCLSLLIIQIEIGIEIGL